MAWIHGRSKRSLGVKNVQSKELKTKGNIIASSSIAFESGKKPHSINLELKQVIDGIDGANAEISLPYKFRGTVHLTVGPIEGENIDKLDMQCEIFD